ncbi:MAG TPA: tetratricopeptide repeat protein [Gemmatimonadales bacterium]|jgi:tetratricopeptide (TPR) repeat protein|nr:tetratricopeptide repeat protein [Gemmatimonadales bacterium]
MRRARHSRSSGREQALDELFATAGLEADQAARGVDGHFSLRPFAGDSSGSGTAEPEPVTEGTIPEQLLRRAREAQDRSRRTEAVEIYRQLLALEPGSLAGRNNLALLFESNGEPEMAIDELNAALRHHPDQIDILINRGAIFGTLKRYAEAEADLRRAIRMAPGNGSAHYNLGLVLWKKGLPEEASEEFRRAVEADRQNEAAWYYLGDARNQAGDLTGAQLALEQAIQLDPGFGKAYHLLGRVFDRMHRPAEAIEMYRKARESATQ